MLFFLYDEMRTNVAAFQKENLLARRNHCSAGARSRRDFKYFTLLTRRSSSSIAHGTYHVVWSDF